MPSTRKLARLTRQLRRSNDQAHRLAGPKDRLKRRAMSFRRTARAAQSAEKSPGAQAEKRESQSAMPGPKVENYDAPSEKLGMWSKKRTDNLKNAARVTINAWRLMQRALPVQRQASPLERRALRLLPRARPMLHRDSAHRAQSLGVQAQS